MMTTSAKADSETIARMNEEALHERNSMLYETAERGFEQGIEKVRKSAVEFMRQQGMSEEVIQNYLVQSSEN